MHLSHLSPRIILAIVIIIVSIVIAYRTWTKSAAAGLTGSKMLIAVSLLLIGLHLLWAELHHAQHDRREDHGKHGGHKKRNSHKDDCECDECRSHHHEVLNKQE